MNLLTTGVDVSGIRNVVFFKYVRSPIAFYQMLGRGTRLDPPTGKLMFRVYDYTAATRLFGEAFRTRATTEVTTPTEEPSGVELEKVLQVQGIDVRVEAAGIAIVTTLDGIAKPVTLEEYKERIGVLAAGAGIVARCVPPTVGGPDRPAPARGRPARRRPVRAAGAPGRAHGRVRPVRRVGGAGLRAGAQDAPGPRGGVRLQGRRLARLAARAHRGHAPSARAPVRACRDGRTGEPGRPVHARRDGGGWAGCSEVAGERLGDPHGKAVLGMRIPLNVDPRGLPEPQGWSWRHLTEIARLESGHTQSRSRPDWWTGGVPWIQLADIRAVDGQVIQSTLETTNAEGIAHSAAGSCPPTPSSCRGPRRSASSPEWPADGDGPGLRELGLRSRPPPRVPDASADTIARLHPLAVRGPIHQTVYYPTVKDFDVCVPPIAEQRRIASELRERLASIDEMTQAIAVQREAIDALPAAAPPPRVRGDRGRPRGRQLRLVFAGRLLSIISLSE